MSLYMILCMTSCFVRHTLCIVLYTACLIYHTVYFARHTIYDIHEVANTTLYIHDVTRYTAYLSLYIVLHAVHIHHTLYFIHCTACRRYTSYVILYAPSAIRLTSRWCRAQIARIGWSGPTGRKPTSSKRRTSCGSLCWGRLEPPVQSQAVQQVQEQV